MKLNKTQIDALADNFYTEIKDKVAKENEISFKKGLEKFKPDYIKGIELLKKNTFIHKLDIDITKGYSASLNRNDSFDKYTKNYVFKNVLNINKTISFDTIKQDIILATIDSKSIDDIMTVLKQKYSK